ncbi:MAG: hypothetical protein IPQ18_08805 [Saprospiraceae bacterium]|nr:hypothetical protein [Saprospiraceae bacterium]
MACVRGSNGRSYKVFVVKGSSLIQYGETDLVRRTREPMDDPTEWNEGTPKKYNQKSPEKYISGPSYI